MQATTSYDGLGSCSVTVDETTNEVTVTIEEDPGGNNGYFGFALDNGSGETVTIYIDNVDSRDFDSSETLVVCPDAANNHKTWTRTDSVNGGATATLDSSSVYITADPPYPYQATVDRVNQLDTDYPDLVTTEVIGQSQQGRDMYAIRITDPDVSSSVKTDIAVMTRHHPGEAAPSYNMDGMIDYVLDEIVNNGRTFERVFHFIPHVNPDGIYNGWDRSDASGVDLNREWDQTDPQIEIANVRSYLETNINTYELGIDLHSGHPPNGAVYYDSSYADSDDVDMIDRIASANVYMDDLYDTYTSGTSRIWFNETYNDFAFTSEIYQFQDYTVDQLEVEEGQTWMQIITEEVELLGATKRVRQNGSWVNSVTM